jgi:hypothetical protein
MFLLLSKRLFLGCAISQNKEHYFLSWDKTFTIFSAEDTAKFVDQVAGDLAEANGEVRSLLV